MIVNSLGKSQKTIEELRERIKVLEAENKLSIIALKRAQEFVDNSTSKITELEAQLAARRVKFSPLHATKEDEDNE